MGKTRQWEEGGKWLVKMGWRQWAGGLVFGDSAGAFLISPLYLILSPSGVAWKFLSGHFSESGTLV